MRLITWFRALVEIQKRASEVLSINNRNLGFIYPNNKRSHFPLANDKLLCKQTLGLVGVAVPETHFSYGSFYELHNLAQDLSTLNEFVIKPANGSAGNGIVVITRQADGGWYSAGGHYFSLADIKKHLSDIIFGVFSHDMMDKAIIEQRIVQHDVINSICDLGLSDIRVILYKDQPVMAMSRIPTSESDGKANLHQGAIGLGIDIDTGETIHAIKDGKPIDVHPDSKESIIGLSIPFWQQVIEMSIKAAEAVPLKYLGVDIAISNQGPVMIEINARPGIEIQNANNNPIRNRLEYVRYLASNFVPGEVK